MILTVDELKKFITTTEPDEVLEMKLLAIESFIRKKTNNTFEDRNYRRTADIVGGLFIVEALNPFYVGDTVLLRKKGQDVGLYTVETAEDSTFTVNSNIDDAVNVSVTKVTYPADVKMGVVNMMKWNLQNGDKAGIQSETISRHSVTYVDTSGDNYVNGYPKSMLGFLKSYRKARF